MGIKKKVIYDKYGYDKDGYDRDGYDEDYEDGYDEDGYDEDGYDEYGYDEYGYDEYGYDEYGYDEYGYNEDGYDEDGYDEYGYDEDGYNEDGYNEDGYDEDGYDQDGYDKYGYDKYGYDKYGYDKYGVHFKKKKKIDKINKSKLVLKSLIPLKGILAKNLTNPNSNENDFVSEFMSLLSHPSHITFIYSGYFNNNFNKCLEISSQNSKWNSNKGEVEISSFPTYDLNTTGSRRPDLLFFFNE
ncbi:hypothetical protein ACTFIY_005638 [Dictyostelium cf. discoideum]